MIHLDIQADRKNEITTKSGLITSHLQGSLGNCGRHRHKKIQFYSSAAFMDSN